MKYYYCVNCGYHGTFKFYRQKNIKCENCSYEYLTKLDEEEYNEWRRLYGCLQDECSFYKTKGRLNPFGQEIGRNGENKGDSNVRRSKSKRGSKK